MGGKCFTNVTREHGASRSGLSARQWIRAGRGHQMLRHPVDDVLESVKPAALILDPGTQGIPIELHVGEVLKDPTRMTHVVTTRISGGNRTSATSVAAEPNFGGGFWEYTNRRFAGRSWSRLDAGR